MPSCLAQQEIIFISRHQDYQEMRSQGSIYELHGLIKCVSIQPYHEVSYFKITLG